MQIAVVGGAGFIGAPLVAQLQADHHVESWDLPDVDITRPDTFRSRLQNQQPDMVINLAAILGDMHSRNVKEILDVNYGGNLELVEACIEYKVPRFLFASSLTVHGENDPARPVTLEAPFAPKHPYSASKAAAEYSLMQYARLHDLTIAAVRPVSIIGETYMNHAPIDFVTTLLQGQPIEIYGTGEHQREWLWIDDVVTGFERAVNYLAQQSAGYHPLFLGGNRITMKDLAGAATKLVGGSLVLTPKQAQAFTLTCDMAETEAKLGWHPENDIAGILQNVLQQVRSTTPSPAASPNPSP